MSHTATLSYLIPFDHCPVIRSPNACISLQQITPLHLISSKIFLDMSLMPYTWTPQLHGFEHLHPSRAWIPTFGSESCTTRPGTVKIVFPVWLRFSFCLLILRGSTNQTLDVLFCHFTYWAQRDRGHFPSREEVKGDMNCLEPRTDTGRKITYFCFLSLEETISWPEIHTY